MASALAVVARRAAHDRMIGCTRPLRGVNAHDVPDAAWASWITGLQRQERERCIRSRACPDKHGRVAAEGRALTDQTDCMCDYKAMSAESEWKQLGRGRGGPGGADTQSPARQFAPKLSRFRGGRVCSLLPPAVRVWSVHPWKNCSSPRWPTLIEVGVWAGGWGVGLGGGGGHPLGVGGGLGVWGGGWDNRYRVWMLVPKAPTAALFISYRLAEWLLDCNPNWFS
jgi:hypothetical protein